MGRGGRAHQDRADGGAVADGGFEHVEQDVGRIQVGADQDVGFAVQGRLASKRARAPVVQRGVAMHFAIALDVRGWQPQTGRAPARILRADLRLEEP